VFLPLDEFFFAVWNGSSKSCSKEWLLQLERDVRTALPVSLAVSDGEMANLRVSQFWLRIKLWELFPRFSFLSTESVHECLTFRYPVAVAIDLTMLAMKLPITSLIVHGVGMVRFIYLYRSKMLTLLDRKSIRHCLRRRRCTAIPIDISCTNGAGS
jgi:SP family general alpha glucoside:H+ symporter-like MFS transporter